MKLCAPPPSEWYSTICQIKRKKTFVTGNESAAFLVWTQSLLSLITGGGADGWWRPSCWSCWCDRITSVMTNISRNLCSLRWLPVITNLLELQVLSLEPVEPTFLPQRERERDGERERERWTWFSRQMFFSTADMQHQRCITIHQTWTLTVRLLWTIQILRLYKVCRQFVQVISIFLYLFISLSPFLFLSLTLHGFFFRYEYVRKK